MRFKFSKNLDYQLAAISAVADLFDSGKQYTPTNARTDFSLLSPGLVTSNALDITPEQLLTNLQTIQKNNGIEHSEKISTLDFSIEMETGTGKTYVYLRTILELNARYGLTKFIILVPSVAIREGVLKTIEQTKEHFRELYNSSFGHFAYDSGKLAQVREFAAALDIQTMIMTIQSFNSDTTVMKQAPDRFHGERPIDIVAKTHPVIIMDEPQNMETELAKSAIDELNPLFKLRYSATHKQVHNLVYRLGPADAYQKGLVKKIEVFGTEIASTGEIVFEIEKIITKKDELPKVRALLETKSNAVYAKKSLLLREGDNLQEKTKNRLYADISVGTIDARRGTVELSNGKVFSAHAGVQSKEAVFRTQIRETIKTHFRKQRDLGENIKVLSLFFIDEVANYRGDDPLIKKIFEEEFEQLKNTSDRFSMLAARAVHEGYFAQDRLSENRKKQETGTEKAREKLTYDLILKNKERLLSFEEPISFIFSHSALKEGWDNPNVFQICTLRDVEGEKERRQQIGRGLRLPVDKNGDRVYDARVNVLTVIANESYERFVSALQTEYEQAGYKNTPKPSNASKRQSVRFKKAFAFNNKEFQELWKRISQKTKYNIMVDSEELIQRTVNRAADQLLVNELNVHINRAQLRYGKNGAFETIDEGGVDGEKLERSFLVSNIAVRIAEETGLTRKTIVHILEKTDTKHLIKRNPETYVRNLTSVIKGVLRDMQLNDGLQYIPVHDAWSLELFGDLDGYIENLVKVEKSVYDYVQFDSEGEKQFAQNLEERRDVKVFVKLPTFFKIDTPLGEYRPDWAIVIETNNGDTLYLVRETKFVDDLGNIRPNEQLKIECGKKHFFAIGFDDFKVIKKTDLSDI